jgi:hypothetical protein
MINKYIMRNPVELQDGSDVIIEINDSDAFNEWDSEYEIEWIDNDLYEQATAPPPPAPPLPEVLPKEYTKPLSLPPMPPPLPELFFKYNKPLPLPPLTSLPPAPYTPPAPRLSLPSLRPLSQRRFLGRGFGGSRKRRDILNKMDGLNQYRTHCVVQTPLITKPKELTKEEELDKFFSNLSQCDNSKEKEDAEIDKFFNDLANRSFDEAIVQRRVNAVKNADDMKKSKKPMNDSAFILKEEDCKKQHAAYKDAQIRANYANSQAKQAKQVKQEEVTPSYLECGIDVTRYEVPVMAANASGCGNYASVSGFGSSLLRNDMDIAVEKKVASDVDESRCLVSRLAKVDSKVVEKMEDNYDEMSNLFNTPVRVIELLREMKTRIAMKSTQDVLLSEVCNDNNIAYRIERAYYRTYPMDRARFSVRMDKGRLLAVLDKMITKYRSLMDDRKILDSVVDLGEEIGDVIEDYSNMEKKVKQYEKFRDILKNMDTEMNTLANLSKELDLVEDYDEIKPEVTRYMKEVSESIIPERLEEMMMSLKCVQARFNYYYRMSTGIRRMLNLSDKENIMSAATPSRSVPTTSSPSTNTVLDFINKTNNEDTMAWSRYFGSSKKML